MKKNIYAAPVIVVNTYTVKESLAAGGNVDADASIVSENEPW